MTAYLSFYQTIISKPCICSVCVRVRECVSACVRACVRARARARACVRVCVCVCVWVCVYVYVYVCVDDEDGVLFYVLFLQIGAHG